MSYLQKLQMRLFKISKNLMIEASPMIISNQKTINPMVQNSKRDLNLT